MSQEMISQKIRRTCEGCGVVKEWELIGMGEETIIEMQNWYTIIREVFFDGKFEKIMVQACSLACTPAAAIKLALPKVAEEPSDDIDLASLRASNMAN
jgi:hypothetical protein